MGVDPTADHPGTDLSGSYLYTAYGLHSTELYPRPMNLFFKSTSPHKPSALTPAKASYHDGGAAEVSIKCMDLTR